MDNALGRRTVTSEEEATDPAHLAAVLHVPSEVTACAASSIGNFWSDPAAVSLDVGESKRKTEFLSIMARSCHWTLRRSVCRALLLFMSSSRDAEIAGTLALLHRPCRAV